MLLKGLVEQQDMPSGFGAGLRQEARPGEDLVASSRMQKMKQGEAGVVSKIGVCVSVSPFVCVCIYVCVSLCVSL